MIVHNYQKLNLISFEYQSGKLMFVSNILSIIMVVLFTNSEVVLRLGYGIYFVTLLAQVISSLKVNVKNNWIFMAIQIMTFLFISIPVLTIIKDSLKLFVYSWFLWPLVIKNCIQVFNFKS